MHNIESITENALSALTIRRRQRSSTAATEARITKLGGFVSPTGIRIKLDRVGPGDIPGPVDITGEDLYALREFLAELPEEAFVRPADPVVVPDRWSDGDIIEEIHGSALDRKRVWIRRDGKWGSLDLDLEIVDDTVESGLVRQPGHWYVEIIRQTSGRDL